MAIDIVTFKVGPYQTNCYILVSGTHAVVVDPGAQPDDILNKIADMGAKLERIILTHGHWDHICAVPYILKKVDIDWYCHPNDMDKLFDSESERIVYDFTHEAFVEGRAMEKAPKPLNEGDVVEVGDASFKVIHTPGHSSGCLSFYCEEAKTLISGDTLFADGNYGRTDFLDGSYSQMMETLDSKFADIPDDVAVLPGHGPASTMGRERELNSHLR